MEKKHSLTFRIPTPVLLLINCKYTFFMVKTSTFVFHAILMMLCIANINEEIACFLLNKGNYRLSSNEYGEKTRKKRFTNLTKILCRNILMKILWHSHFYDSSFV